MIVTSAMLVPSYTLVVSMYEQALSQPPAHTVIADKDEFLKWFLNLISDEQGPLSLFLLKQKWSLGTKLP